MAVAAAGSAVPAARSPWVVSPLADSLFVIGAPVLIVPVLYLLSQFIEPIALAGFVLGAVSTGHHFPGFVRTYSDPVLFARYRFRFVVIPPLLFAAVFWFTWNDLHAVVLMVGIWGVWHGFMQLYGFMRIYDAKSGENAPWTARLDWLICSVGFVSILLWSTSASRRILEAAEGSGLFFLPLFFGETAQQVAIVLAGVTAVVYAVYTAVQIQRGHPISPLKLVLLVVSMVCLFFSWVMAGTAVLLGLAVWEAFHDIQYEAIAWQSNRRLAERPDAGPLLRRLYGPGVGLVVVYAIMCTTYGAIANGQGISANRLVGALLFSIVLTSAIFHFYTDGFIWKVRQAKTRDDLGIPSANGAPEIPATGKILAGRTDSRDIAHVLLLALPLVVFGTCGAYRAELEIPVRSAIVSVLPGAGDQQIKLGAAYQRRGALAAAETAYRAAIAADPSRAIAHHNLALVFGRQARLADAEASFRRALELDPKLRPSALALGNLLIAQRRAGEAEELVRGALALAPDAPELKSALARALLAESPDETQVAEALEQAAAAVQQTRFSDANPLVTLAQALAAQQRFNRAVRLLERAQQMESVRQNPALARKIDRDLRHYRSLPQKRG